MVSRDERSGSRPPSCFGAATLRLVFGRHGAAALVTAAVAIALWPAFFAGRVFFLRDAQIWFYPSRLCWRSRVLQGDLPLWLPELRLGMPFLADPGHGVLYPLNLVLLLPAPACVSQFLALHVILAGLGAYALGRHLRLSQWPAAFGALGFALGGYLLSMTWSGTYLLSIAWLPLVAALTLRAGTRGRLADVALAALALGCQILSGEEQGVVFTAAAVAALLAVEPLPWRERGRAALRMLGVALLGLCLALPQVLPTLELLRRSTRASGLDLTETTRFSFHPLRLVELVAPGLYGDPVDFNRFLGFFMSSEEPAMHLVPWMASPYLGSLTLALLLVAAVLARGHRRRVLLALGALATVALLLAFGRHTSLFPSLIANFPGAGVFRYPAKYFGLVAIAVPLGGALGLEILREQLKAGRGRAVALALGTAGLAAATLGLAAPLLAPRAGAALAAQMPESLGVRQRFGLDALAVETVRDALLMEAVSLALLSFLLYGVYRLRRGWLAPAVVAALAAQLLWANHRVPRTTTPDLYEPSPMASHILARSGQGTLPRLLARDDSLPRADSGALSPEERAALCTRSLRMNTGIVFGVEYFDAYTAVHTPETEAFSAATEEFLLPLLDGYAVSWLLAPPDVEVPPGAGLQPVEGLGEINLFFNSRARPPAWPVARSVAVAGFDEALEALSDGEVLRGDAVVLENPPEGVGVEPGTEALGACTLARPTGDDIVVRCDLETEAWVVVTEAFHPSWRAAVDGMPVPVFRANALVMAVLAPAGSHEIALRYQERTLPVGLTGSALALLALVALLVVDRRRRSSRARTEAP